MPLRTCRSMYLFSSLWILLLVKDSIQSPPTRKRVLSPHSNPLTSSTNEATQPTQPAQGDLSPLIRWEEEEGEVHGTKPSTSSSASPETLQRKRKLLWWTGTLDDRPWLDDKGRRKRQSMSDSEPESQPQPHPLRTDVWKLTVRWRQQHSYSRQNKKKATTKDMLLEFADNGYVRLCPQHDDIDTADADKSTAIAAANTPIGTWKLDPSGLSWHFPLNDTEHYFFADIHINPFGPYPKMTRGIVIREHGRQSWKSWFRPVVATFVGTGVGTDTADFSYRHRNFGLYQAEKQTDSL
jgi:hypothetical protein